MVTGPFTDDDLGVACYHSKTGAVELYLNHLVDGPGEYVVVDCTAGADSFASGMFTRFDLTFLVAEPTRKGVAVYRQWTDYAADYDVALGRDRQQGPRRRRRRVPARARRRRPAGLPRPVRRRARAWSRAARSASPTSATDDRGALAALRRPPSTPRPRTGRSSPARRPSSTSKNARAWANAATGQDLDSPDRPRLRHGSRTDCEMTGQGYRPGHRTR